MESYFKEGQAGEFEIIDPNANVHNVRFDFDVILCFDFFAGSSIPPRHVQRMGLR